MAANTFTGATSGAWGTATNWSLGTVPTATDTHTTTFDAASPACTLGANRVCWNLNMSAYTNTLTMSTNSLSAYGNTITLGAAMTLSGTGALQSYANGITVTITSNGCYVPYLFLSGINAHTITLADDWSCGVFQSFLSTNVVLTVNGNKIFVYDNWNLGTGNRQMAGTTTIEFTGALDCLWGGTVNTGSTKNPIIINKSGGTLTLGAYINLNTGCILTHTAGTVDAVTNNNTLYIQGATTLDTSAITWNTIFIVGGAAAYNITINSLLTADIIYLNYFSVNFIGTNVWTCNTFILIGNISAGDFISLKAASTYTINTEFRIYSSTVYPFLIKSGTPASVAYLVFNGGSNQKIINCDATDIDSSGGDQIWTLDGVLSNTTNWGVSDSSIPPVAISSSCC